MVGRRRSTPVQRQDLRPQEFGLTEADSLAVSRYEGRWTSRTLENVGVGIQELLVASNV